jgi:hypothetical protein
MPEVLHQLVAPSKQRAQGMPGARRTHCLACKQEKRTRGQHRYAEIIRHSLRNGFTAAPCSSWCAGLFSHHRLGGVSGRRPTSPIRRLDSSVGEPEPHGLTVRVGAHHLTRFRVHRSPPHVKVTIGRNVLVSKRDNSDIRYIPIYVNRPEVRQINATGKSGPVRLLYPAANTRIIRTAIR